MRSGKIVLSVLTGAMAGALFGVLFAPEKGSVIRKKIAKKGEGGVDALKDKVEEVKEAISDCKEQRKAKSEPVYRP